VYLDVRLDVLKKVRLLLKLEKTDWAIQEEERRKFRKKVQLLLESEKKAKTKETEEERINLRELEWMKRKEKEEEQKKLRKRDRELDCFRSPSKDKIEAMKAYLAEKAKEKEEEAKQRKLDAIKAWKKLGKDATLKDYLEHKETLKQIENEFKY